MPSQTPQLNVYQDHFRQYPEVPESSLVPIERRVRGEYNDHAIGATAVALVERHDELVDTGFELNNHRRQAQEVVDSIPTRDSIKYSIKYQEKPLPGLRKFIQRMGYMDVVNKKDLDRNQKELAKELIGVREKISNAPKDIIMGLAATIERGASPYISAMYWHSVDEAERSEEPQPDPVDWLLEDSEAGDLRLINFLKFSVNAYEKLQDDPSRNELVAKEKKEWLGGVEKATDDGWLIIDKAEIESGMDELIVRFGDYFDLAAQDRGGYAYNGKKHIVLGKGHRDIRHAAKHELNHALLGQFKDTWLNEATTEHIAQTLDGRRSVEEVSDEKSDAKDAFYDGAYRNERDLLAALLDMTGGAVKMADVTRAYSKSNIETPLEDSYIELELMFDTALGVEFSLSKIQSHVLSLQHALIAQGHRPYRALHEACRVTRSDLLQQPDVIFGNSKQKAA